MNLLGFIFSLLLLLTYSFAACWEKHVGASRMRTSYLGHHRATDLLVNQSESAIYNHLSHKKNPKEKEESAPKESKQDLNSACARLNLWPLVQEGRSAHPKLYDITCQLLDAFYGPLLNGSSQEFLDRFLKSAKAVPKDPDPTPLEKILLSSEEDRLVYYRMLKGTKGSRSYPSLLDYVKIDPKWTEKLCLSHADPSLLRLLFGPKVGDKLYSTLHEEIPPSVTPELIDHLCGEVHTIAPDAVALYDLLLFGPPNHDQPQTLYLCAEDPVSHISLKTQVFLHQSH